MPVESLLFGTMPGLMKLAESNMSMHTFVCMTGNTEGAGERGEDRAVRAGAWRTDQSHDEAHRQWSLEGVQKHPSLGTVCSCNSGPTVRVVVETGFGQLQVLLSITRLHQRALGAAAALWLNADTASSDKIAGNC